MMSAKRHSLTETNAPDSSPSRSRKRHGSRDSSAERERDDDDDHDEHAAHAKHHKKEHRPSSRKEASPDKEAQQIPVSDKEKQLVDWVSSRLEEHAWYSTVKDAFKNKLATYQSGQLLRPDRVAKDLIEEIGNGLRSSVPDKIKKDLLDAVKDYLQTQPDKVLRQLDETKRRTVSAIKQ
ncbi:uncharacterized protein LOC129596054 [Paramacrobiotus metropolitanus]|uniref:uncharacterized protein LOC129594921 n=1 Tax=Paramacrobiotus metropolitanus TaxID=2943436 RepID=UPI0024465A8D|nr:uncharacterized protein LOC129594921 [Paramacrobiotus metropolitanus]XP_055349186.1 uncharacterized protein LOC129596054 [Paramacrobiotus metropolitanus]